MVDVHSIFIGVIKKRQINENTGFIRLNVSFICVCRHVMTLSIYAFLKFILNYLWKMSGSCRTFFPLLLSGFAIFKSWTFVPCEVIWVSFIHIYICIIHVYHKNCFQKFSLANFDGMFPENVITLYASLIPLHPSSLDQVILKECLFLLCQSRVWRTSAKMHLTWNLCSNWSAFKVVYCLMYYVYQASFLPEIKGALLIFSNLFRK